MIEIISHGEKFEPKYITKCFHCGCVFSYNDHDRHGFDMLYKDQYVTCPDCGKWNVHDFRTKEFKVRYLLLEQEKIKNKLRGF